MVTETNPGQPAVTPRAIESNRMAGRARSETLSQELAADQRGQEMARLFREPTPDGQLPMRLAEIAERVIPDHVLVSEGVALSATGRAIRRLIPSEEFEAIKQRRQTAFSNAVLANMGEEDRRAMTQKGREAHAANLRAGITTVDPKGIIEGQGRTRWSEEEVTVLRLLAASPEFRDVVPRWGDSANNGKIADFLNKVFHREQLEKGKKVRSRGSVFQRIKEARREK